MNKQELIKTLGLIEHQEGGYFAETFRSDSMIPVDREGSSRLRL